MTATELRQQLYVILGRLADTGETVRITHKNHVFSLVPEEPRSFRDRLVRHPTLLVQPDELVASDANGRQWNEERNFDRLS
jgi:antitoxin (DNA-binding transcriptional repressor) of toxin-antitoxin stability system